jgi:4-hydroxy-tetrahydrodipicolinate synthase
VTKPSGVILPLATPLTQGQVDRTALARLIEFVLHAGVNALFANGSMGGFAFHTDETQVELIETVVELARGRVPVYSGVSDTSAERVLTRISRLRTLPLRAVVALPPFFYRYAQPDLEAFFVAIANASPFPVLLYDNPKQVANALTASTIENLAQHPNIHGIKHSGDDPTFWRELLTKNLPRERFGLICGAELKMSSGLAAGFDGITGGFHNVVPDLAVAIFRAATRGDWHAADLAQEKIVAMYPEFVREGGFRGLNAAMARLGVGGVYTPTFMNIPHQEVPQ